MHSTLKTLEFLKVFLEAGVLDLLEDFNSASLEEAHVKSYKVLDFYSLSLYINTYIYIFFIVALDSTTNK